MAYYSLVVHELTPELVQAGEDLLAALDHENVPVSAAFWLRGDDEESHWRLVLASSEVDRDGRRAFYNKVGDILRSAGIEELGVVHLAAERADNPLVLRLRRALKFPKGRVRMTGNVIEGELIPDILIYRLP